jgi:hypothetical protein
MAFAEDMVKLLTLRCREAAALLSAAQDGELSRMDRWALRGHLLICGPCRRYPQVPAAIAQAGPHH